ncbi:hypothetical protein PybrP1_006835 [[Pythium] brassicae (nom. inval.)]|nr:hypothetical protein PybrP1_006835 [[Pythium] brassicae (nom. inval.)]
MEQVGGSSNGSADACARSNEPPFALTLHRKPKKRASGASSDALERAANERDESEFVSVEVGMREFQRRLAGRKRASTSKDPASRASSAAHAPPKAPRTAQVAQAVAAAGDASRGSKQPAKRARTAKAAGGAPLGAKTTMKAKASAATRAPGKADAKANAKTNAKTAPGQANAPAKPRAKRAPRRPTIAEIRAELLREQQERVETRIQTLHCANCSSVTHAESHVHTHGVQRPLPSPLLLPSVSPQTGTVPVALQELHVANAAAPLGIAQFFAPSVLLGAAPPQTTAVGALEPPAVPYDATHNEFIDDDFDEDMAFVIALDQVERSLTTPTKPPPPPPPRTLQAANTVAESIGSQSVTSSSKQTPPPNTVDWIWRGMQPPLLSGWSAPTPTRSQPADEIEPSQDDGAAENHALGDEVDDEVLEMSQEAPARESTIDRGNYDQYKTVGDDDAENDAEDGVGDGEEKHRQVQSGDVDMVDAEQDPMATFPPGDRVSSGDVGHPMPSTPSLTRDCVPEVMTGDETESDNSNAGNDDDESESESEQPGGDGAANGLEAALKAASSRGASSNTATPLKSGNTRASRDAFSLEATGDARVQLGKSSSSHAKLLQKKKKRSRVSDSESDNETAAGAGKRVARPASQLGSGASISSFGGGSGSSTTTTSSIKSTLLWPALDDFYDFILDLSPRRIEVSQKHQTNLRRYSRDAKLPATYATLNEFVSVQIEAIMEELAASLRSAEQSSGQHSPKHLQLTSVSPCGRSHSGQQAVGSGQRPLNSSAIFMESGFSGSMSNTNDFIVTFQPPHGGKKGSSSNFVSGDLVMLRSPRWKSYEMLTFGVVLCNSVVAVGGGSDSRGTGSRGGGGGRDSDLICVLVRTQERDHAHPREDFAALTEMCLANPRSPNWTWRLEYVHNLTTSAREFQAMKSVAFFSPATKRSLLEGKLSSTAAAPKQLKQEHGKSGKAMGAGIAGVSGFVSSAQQPSALPPALLQELEKKYNASQLDAILGCVGDESHVIIQGPPGTGKTKTILGVLSALLDGSGLKKAKESTRIRVGASLTSANGAASAAKPSIRILVAAPSNAAVDELIVRLLSEGVYDGVKRCSYHPRIVRVGRPESLQPLSSSSSSSSSGGSLQTDSKKIKQSKWRKYAKEVEEILLETLVTKHKSAFPSARAARQSIIEGAQVVFCTLSGAGSVAMCDFAQAFDALVIDEAAQAVEASTLIPFKFRPSRVVFVGDHQQLPATVVAKSLLDLGYDRSLFQRFVANGSRVFLLDRQYRMHPDIAAFPSQYFYKGRLVQDAKLRDWTARLYHASRLFAPFVFFDVAAGQQSHVSGSKSLRNLSEVDFVLLLVRKLLAQYPAVDWRKKIGVIAPYKQQVYELSARLERLERDADREPLEVEVNTVDGFQGREKEVIIYSCVRTSSSWKRRGKGTAPLDAFWADERRMNVAITRAKSALWIVGSARLLEQSPAWRALIRAAKDRKCYVLSADAEL